MTDPLVDGVFSSSGCSSATGVTSNISLDSHSSSGGLISPAPNIHNGCTDETLFTKPPSRDGMTAQVNLHTQTNKINLN